MALAKKKVIYCTGHGSYLGVLHSKQSFRLVKNDDSVEELPFCRCSSIYVTDGNTVSSNALFIAGMYNIPVLVLSQTGRIISTLRSVESDYDVEYDAYRKAKKVRIAKEILLAKVQKQIEFLDKYGLDSAKIHPHIDRIKSIKAKNLSEARRLLVMMEANCTKVYFHEYVSLFGFEKIPSRRLANKHGAKDIFNNVLNLSYEVLKAECFRACYNAHLDPFLGYLHSTKHGKFALVCDLQEFFRVEVNEFLYKKRKMIDYERIENTSGRDFLQNEEALKLITMLNDFLDTKRKTRVKFGTSSEYSRRSIIKFQTRQICNYLEEGKIRIL